VAPVVHRHASMISRLYSAYAADRDRNKETLLAKQFSNNAIRNPDILSSLTLHRDHPVPTGRAALAQQ
jgi:hypothetical protein